MKARLIGAFLLYLLFGATVRGQGAGAGTLAGRIVDQHGEALPGVVLELTGPQGDRAGLSTVTSADGAFSFQGVPPGADYALKASIPGFATTVAEKIEVHEGKTTIIALTLTPSSEAEETIRVEARGEIVDTSATSTTTTYNAEFLEELPLVGRRFNDVLILAPGVSDTDGDGNVNIRGARDTGLQLRLDGTNISDPFTGHSGRRINLESVQEVELITGGAPAEYGQASGGFVNVITKTGNNDFEGSFKVFYRSDFLDGDGASPTSDSVPRFSDTDVVLTFGGPIVSDRLWYFATVERLDEEKPVSFANNTFGVETRKGVNAFGKLTWQVDTENRLALQLISGPLRTGGNNIGSRVDPESDFFMRSGGPLAQIGWTAIVSPALLLQSLVSHDIGGLDVEPVSSDFRVIQVDRQVDGNGVFTAILPCVIRNCINEPGLSRFFHAPGRTTSTGKPGPLQEAGPYNFSSLQDVERTTARSDLSYSIEGKGGQHAIKSGFEFNVETYLEESTNNPVLTDNTCEGFDCNFLFTGTPLPGSRDGLMNLLVFDPVVQQLKADGFRIGAYAQDSWKPLPNLTINMGLRWDREEIDSEGFHDFDPRPEALEALRRFDLVCNVAGSSCTGSRTPGRRNGQLPAVVVVPPGDPAEELDLNGDGLIDLFGPEGALLTAPFTDPNDRVPDTLFIANNNLSPRLSLSWDPWSDGKTKVFGNWGIYYDRLFLQSVTTEQQPQSYTATWVLSLNNQQADPGSHSETLSGHFSIPQTDRGLSTPYTVEWTAGVERELAPEWAVSLTWISRRGKDLLQDVDINHITCKGFDTTLHVDPMDVCGDGGVLELDRFGDIAPTSFRPFRSRPVPNGAPDLYNLNPNFNQVLRVGNFNSSTYTAAELVLRKRLRHNWQMQLGYTWSKALGESESFSSPVGNDPAVSDKQSGYLNFDQRHVLKWQAVVHLRNELLLGGTIEWASGLPFSFVANDSDYDDAGNLTPQRVFSVSGTRNDQRNNSQLTVNGRVEKRFAIGRTFVSAFLDGENLLNTDDLVLTEVDQNARSTPEGTRRFGRRWQIGFEFLF